MDQPVFRPLLEQVGVRFRTRGWKGGSGEVNALSFPFFKFPDAFGISGRLELSQNEPALACFI